MKKTIAGDNSMLGSKDEVRPNFLIVGAARSGTTSLYHWLEQHPEVFMPDMKEPSYFVNGYGISDWCKYLALFESAGPKTAIGEASTAYLVAPESAHWIHRTLGNVKIIILLRDPSERALSLYCWMVMEGYEWLYPFERALAEEEKRFHDKSFRRDNPEYFWDYMYFRSGLYYEQVRRYLEVFNTELVRIYLFEDFVHTPAKLYRDVCEFLGIDPEFQPVFTHENPSCVPRLVRLQYGLRKVQRVKILNRFPGILKLGGLAMRFNKRVGHKPRLSTELRQELKQKHHSDVMKLSALIQRDLSCWLC